MKGLPALWAQNPTVTQCDSSFEGCAPAARSLGALLNPNFPPVQDQLDEVQEVARATGLQIHVLRASIDREIDAAFDSIAQTAHRRTLGGHRSILRHPPRVLVVEYPDDAEQAQEVRRQISALGFIGLTTGRDLDSLPGSPGSTT